MPEPTKCPTCHRPRFSDRHLAQVTRERDEARARVAELEGAQPYREVWSDECPPGGMVCSICGVPVESEPCSKHGPGEEISQREPIGFAVVYTSESGQFISGDSVLTLGYAQIKAARSRRASFDACVVELREVTD